jgi:hypothetical protein
MQTSPASVPTWQKTRNRLSGPRRSSQSPESDWAFQWLPISRFHIGCAEELRLDSRPDERVVLDFDGPQMALHFVRIDQFEGRLSGHDHFYGHDGTAGQISGKKRRN